MYKIIFWNFILIITFLTVCFLNINFLYSESGISIGAKNFTESKIIAGSYAQAIEKSGYKVNRKLNLGGTLIAHESFNKVEINFT